jgi:hypothetical protein
LTGADALLGISNEIIRTGCNSLPCLKLGRSPVTVFFEISSKNTVTGLRHGTDFFDMHQEVPANWILLKYEAPVVNTHGYVGYLLIIVPFEQIYFNADPSFWNVSLERFREQVNPSSIPLLTFENTYLPF